MGLLKISWLILLFWVFFSIFCDGALQNVSFKFLMAPLLLSRLNTATFVFTDTCTNCRVNCKLDDGSSLDCGARKVSYSGLADGDHTFKVCATTGTEVSCTSYNWTVDTVPPTAYITTSTLFTNAFNVSVNISFSEPCLSRLGFICSSTKSCNLLVYGAGQVIPSSLTVLEPNLKYSLLVALSSTASFGRAIMVMDKNFCTDFAGNAFKRAENSSIFVRFDRRNVFVNLRTHVPEKLLQLSNQIRTVQATNNYDKLKVYLYFSESIRNSTTEILNSVKSTQGTLLPITGETLGNRRFGFMVVNMTDKAIITVNLDSSSIISRQGTPVSLIAPVTFLFDSERPSVRLSTTSHMRTREHNIPISIKFTKPVFSFNATLISISGGTLMSFHEISKNTYVAEIKANVDTISINVPENATEDVAGNKNLASNVLHVRHYSVPLISCIISAFATASFSVTSFVAGLLTVSTASLQSLEAFSRPPSSLTAEPTRNLFRFASHIQVFALSRWLPVTLPLEYYEFTRGLQWSVPYFPLPWETKHVQSFMAGSGSSFGPNWISQSMNTKEEILNKAGSLYGLPLTEMEYRSFFESSNLKPEAEFILDPQHSSGWRDFNRSMFWLAVTGCSLLLLHALLFLILRFRKTSSENKKRFGALIFPRFEIFLLILALPCICKASTGLVKGGVTSGVMAGALLLSAVAFLLLALFLFLSIGITLGKLLQYKEVHQEGQTFHWYQELVRVTLGPGKRGQWTWKNKPNSIYLAILGPLFEDLRGPPKYMLSQISQGNTGTQDDRIIASDDENEDAEAPFIQKLFGVLRIYYTILETAKRVSIGIIAGGFLENKSAMTPILLLLCITSFQLFFIVLKKPFIKKKVQLVEIVAVSCEVATFATCLVLLKTESEAKIGLFMLFLFLVGFLAQMINEWYALYLQTKRLDYKNTSFISGLKMAAIGFLLFFIPQKFIKNFESKFEIHQYGETADTSPSVDKYRSSGSRRSSGSKERPWHKQLRELAKASFTKDGSGTGTSNDPSSSVTRWSGFWGSTKKSGTGSSSLNSSSDFKSKPSKLYKDLEDIFANK